MRFTAKNKLGFIRPLYLIALTFNIVVITFQAFHIKGCSEFSPGEYILRIHNRIFVYPETNIPLKVHCASKDREIGYHTVSQSKDIFWGLCMNIWRSTMYFCHFWWGNKEAAFEVFNNKIARKCSGDLFCLWVVRADGIALTDYFSYREIDFYHWRDK
ncbi:hypothetical protein PHJA_000105600 [Phtheirospermum japonicum]|uniref:S-protein homolog n=1 Tax=Phtheirospermum japonicum TaxID=374723 RepID=A0A830BC46_9LAMI|nr:hypothetical protein PHJA_000105600 [Phtheirospermum japonicum]